MNNGRMTFRFDEDRDKYKPRPEESRLGVVKDSSDEGFGEDSREDLGEYRRQNPWKDPGKSFAQGRGSSPENDRGESSQEIIAAESMWSYIPELEYELSDPPDHAGKGYEYPPREDHLDDRLDDLLDDRFDDLWDSPNLDTAVVEAGYRSGGSFYTRRPSRLWKFALSTAGAIATGLLLGYAALSLFNGSYTQDEVVVSTNKTVSVGNEVVGAGDDPAGVGTSGLPLTESGEAITHHIPVQVAEQTYYMLQYGVFSTPTGAEQAQQELLTAGLAASIDPSDGNRVYAGISPDRELAKLLSNGLKSQGIELYVREVTLPAVDQLAFQGSAETLNNYFNVSGRLLGGLSTLSATLLNNGTGTLTSDDISNLHLEWTEAVRALSSSSSPETLSIITALEKSISQGISAWSEYNKNKSDGLLWEIQGSVMNSLNEQKRLLSALN